jgi:hypothetical protein
LGLSGRHADPSPTGSPLCFEVKLLLMNFVLLLWLLIYQKYPELGEEISTCLDRCLQIAIRMCATTRYKAFEKRENPYATRESRIGAGNVKDCHY